MVIVSHGIKNIAKFRLSMLCDRGDDADRIIFRWVNLNKEFWCFLRRLRRRSIIALNLNFMQIFANQKYSSIVIFITPARKYALIG